MAEGGGELIEVFGYFIGFWLFIFSRKFRLEWLKEFVQGGRLTRAEMLLGAIGSVFRGLGIPSVPVY